MTRCLECVLRTDGSGRASGFLAIGKEGLSRKTTESTVAGSGRLGRNWDRVEISMFRSSTRRKTRTRTGTRTGTRTRTRWGQTQKEPSRAAPEQRFEPWWETQMVDELCEAQLQLTDSRSWGPGADAGNDLV